jgi:hypothetical protein
MPRVPVLLIPALLLITVAACGPSLDALGPTAAQHAALLAAGPPPVDAVQAYRLRPAGNREELVAQLDDLRDHGLAGAIFKALPVKGQEEIGELAARYGFDPVASGDTLYLWEVNRPETGDRLPNRMVAVSDGETLRGFLSSFVAREVPAAPTFFDKDADLIWLAPLDGGGGALLEAIADRAPPGQAVLAQPAKGIHILTWTDARLTSVAYCWPGGLLVSTRRTDKAGQEERGMAGLVQIFEDLRAVAGSGGAGDEPGVGLPELRVIFDRHRGGIGLDIHLGDRVSFTAAMPLTEIGGDGAAEHFQAKWDRLRGLAETTPEALKLELGPAAEYADLVALLLLHSEVVAVTPTIRIHAEVELDLLLTTLLKVQTK